MDENRRRQRSDRATTGPGAVENSNPILNYLEVSFSSFPGHVAGRPHREGHDGECGVLFRESRETASVHYEQVVHVVRLAVAVQHGIAAIVTHAYGASFVARKAGWRMIVFHHHGSFGFVQDLRAFFAHIFPYRPVVVAEAEMDYRDRNTIGVFP